MSNIPRLYCIVLIEKDTRVFCDVAAVAFTIEEAKHLVALHNNLIDNSDTHTHIIVPVIVAQQ